MDPSRFERRDSHRRNETHSPTRSPAKRGGLQSFTITGNRNGHDYDYSPRRNRAYLPTHSPTQRGGWPSFSSASSELTANVVPGSRHDGRNDSPRRRSQRGGWPSFSLPSRDVKPEQPGNGYLEYEVRRGRKAKRSVVSFELSDNIRKSGRDLYLKMSKTPGVGYEVFGHRRRFPVGEKPAGAKEFVNYALYKSDDDRIFLLENIVDSESDYAANLYGKWEYLVPSAHIELTHDDMLR